MVSKVNLKDFTKKILDKDKVYEKFLLKGIYFFENGSRYEGEFNFD